MLTKKDLGQIGKVVEEKTGRIVEQKVSRIVEEKTGQIIEQKVSRIVEEKLTKALKPIHKQLKIIVKFFDHEVLRLRRRVTRVEDHLDLPPLS